MEADIKKNCHLADLADINDPQLCAEYATDISKYLRNQKCESIYGYMTR
jgi:hypothetical protein